jgi:hypothetical protein
MRGGGGRVPGWEQREDFDHWIGIEGGCILSMGTQGGLWHPETHAVGGGGAFLTGSNGRARVQRWEKMEGKVPCTGMRSQGESKGL